MCWDSALRKTLKKCRRVRTFINLSIIRKVVQKCIKQVFGCGRVKSTLGIKIVSTLSSALTFFQNGTTLSTVEKLVPLLLLTATKPPVSFKQTSVNDEVV